MIAWLHHAIPRPGDFVVWRGDVSRRGVIASVNDADRTLTVVGWPGLFTRWDDCEWVEAVEVGP